MKLLLCAKIFPCLYIAQQEGNDSAWYLFKNKAKVSKIS